MSISLQSYWRTKFLNSYSKINVWQWHAGGPLYQGSKKPPSGRPRQVDFKLGQVTFHGHLPDGQAPSQNPFPTK